MLILRGRRPICGVPHSNYFGELPDAVNRCIKFYIKVFGESVQVQLSAAGHFHGGADIPLWKDTGPRTMNFNFKLFDEHVLGDQHAVVHTVGEGW